MAEETSEKTGVIYMLIFPSGKKYIGQTIRTFEKRFKEHCDINSEYKALSNAIKKYGVDNIKSEILINTYAKYLDKYEIAFIAEYNTMCPNGYNIRSGGVNGKHCAESRKRMSEAKKGSKNPNWNKPRSKEFKMLMKIKKSGENHHFYGKKFTKEHLLRLSKVRRKDPNNMLPMYMIYIKARPKSHSGKGYSISNHPERKQFTLITKKLNLEEKYKIVLNYLNTGKLPKEYTKNENEEILPNYIYIAKQKGIVTGYRVVSHPEYKNSRFVNPNISLEQRKKDAIHYSKTGERIKQKRARNIKKKIKNPTIKEDLKQYCRNNNIKGFSRKNIKELKELIKNSENLEDIEEILEEEDEI